MRTDYQGLATKGLKGAGWYAKTMALNTLRRVLILGRYTLACWQKQKANKAMRRLGEQFFQALEQGETNPLVVSAVSDAVKKAKRCKRGPRTRIIRPSPPSGRRCGPPGPKSPRRRRPRSRRPRPPSRLRSHRNSQINKLFSEGGGQGLYRERPCPIPQAPSPNPL